MRKGIVLLLLVCLFSGLNAFLYANEDEGEDSGDSGSVPVDAWEGFVPDLYSRGDQTFTITMGTVFPLIFVNNGSKIEHNFTPPVGGAGSLGYTFFLSSNLFVGAEIGFTFNSTLRGHMVYFIPIGLRGGWQFVARRVEIPLYAAAGIAPIRYNTLSYLGFYLKGGVGAYYRFNPDWSFGLNTDWNWYPQRPRDDGTGINKNVDANILGLTISARYHF